MLRRRRVAKRRRLLSKKVKMRMILSMFQLKRRRMIMVV